MTDHGFTIPDFRYCIDQYAALVAPNIRDLFPILRYIPGLFGLAEWKEQAQLVRKEALKKGTQFLNVAKEQRAALDAGKSIEWESMLAKMLRDQRDNDDHTFSEHDMGHSAFHVVAASTSTSTAKFSVLLMVLAKYSDVQQKVREEVLEISGGAIPKATDIPSLKYTEAVWNEVHRWRPVAPQAIPHAPSQDDVYNGYRIPKGTAVIMNVWHIHHSEEDYEEPEEFIPERFLNHPFGMRPDKAHDGTQMEASGARITYDFGAGRRVCPGMHSTKQTFLLGLAKILWAFEILPLEGKNLDLSLKTRFVQEVALHPKSLDVSLKLKNGRTGKTIIGHYHQKYEDEAKVMGWENDLYR
ncbi:hypothetical protein HYALB_00008166 [Hymenoscyphus albidus]|uniref:Cytochrome P450 n=1 Tax=Hymenoscyphus albidus TaxID=595503 RepID=A0A9N9QDI0_9HELO|nr:hypothetical protein HYALB_00008166 [Hymenoscyphus albidus]